MCQYRVFSVWSSYEQEQLAPIAVELCSYCARRIYHIRQNIVLVCCISLERREEEGALQCYTYRVMEHTYSHNLLQGAIYSYKAVTI